MDFLELEQKMKGIGFDDKETKIYLSLLRLGEITATKISQDAKIERTLVYYITDKLIERGLVSYKIKNNVKYFSASDPNKILEEIKDKEKSFLEILPLLEQLKSSEYEEEIKVDVYKGKEGLKTIMNDIIKFGQDIYVLGEEGQIEKEHPMLYRNYMLNLKSKGGKEFIVVREDLKGKIFPLENSSFRYISKELISPTTIIIYANKVVFIIWEKPGFNIMVTSKIFSESFKSYFNYFWKIAKK